MTTPMQRQGVAIHATLMSSKGEPHVLEEHDDEHATSRGLRSVRATEMHAAQAAEDENNRQRYAEQAVEEAAKAASGKYAHTYMMDGKHDHLDYKIDYTWTAEETQKYDLNMNKLVHDCLETWFEPEYAGYTPPSDGDVERATRFIQAKVYQTIQREVDKQKVVLRERWPRATPERFDISSTAGDDN